MLETQPTYNKSILIAIDQSENSRRAVAHLAAMVCGLPEFRVTLLHVYPDPEEDYFPTEAERVEGMRAERAEIDEMLRQAKDFLVRQGFSAEHIETVVETGRIPSVSEAILRVRERGGHSTIVLGRQGLGAKEEFLLGSVSKRVLSHANHCAVWIMT